MANLSIREAVKFYRVSRPTLSKALKDGTVSGVKDGKGHWQIDRAELSRVYTPRTSEGVKDGKALPAKLTTLYTPENSEVEQLKSALAVAEARAEAAETLAKERAERIEDLRRMLPPPEAPKTAGWRWPWQK